MDKDHAINGGDKNSWNFMHSRPYMYMAMMSIVILNHPCY